MLKGGAYIVSLKRYIVDLTKLSSQERENIYRTLENKAFTTEPKAIGIYEVFWESSFPIEKSIDFPIGTIISQI
jgi:hypothetical protein